MIKLNNYIIEAWSGVKQHSLKSDVEAWCDKIGVRKYNINDEGKIDVDRFVNLFKKDFKEIPYKFGKVKDFFTLQNCKNLTSLKNCPDIVTGNFRCSGCSQLDSLEGCPKEVEGDFWCNDCKKKFTKEEVMSLCKVKGSVVV